MSSFNILSIDGGGIKGITSAIVIAALEKAIKVYSGNPAAALSDYFQMIAGTSTGSILTGIYLCPDEKGKARFTAEDAVKLYQNHGSEIFQSSLFYRFQSLFGLHRSKFKNVNLYKILDEYFGDIRLSQLRKPCLIPSFEIHSDSAYFFNTVSAQKDINNDFYLKDAILASTAAPTYFPPVEVASMTHHLYQMVDGGVCCNNPSLCAFVEAMKMPMFTSFENVNIFSVGNVSREQTLSYCNARKWGLVNWAPPLIKIFMDASTQTVDYQMKMLYNSMEHRNNYIRIEKIVEESCYIPGMDDADAESIQMLKEIGEELVAKHQKEINDFARKICWE